MKEKSTDWLFRLLAFYFIVAMHIYWPNRGGSGFYLPWNIVGIILLAIITLVTMIMARPPLARSCFFKHLMSGTVILLLPLLWTSAPYFGEALPRFIGLLMGGGCLFFPAAIPIKSPVASLAIGPIVNGQRHRSLLGSAAIFLGHAGSNYPLRYFPAGKHAGQFYGLRAGPGPLSVLRFYYVPPAMAD
ncbi:hypothetical protein [Serratia fonticola]|uniref:hypothetical protein n=1 Tax=Serratia fonticola TaxID=47917 RepID=UPI001FD7C6AA|nr:hypothetical protein [Serratia fonticola]